MNTLLVVSFAVSSLGVVACVLFLGWYLNRRFGASWKWWALGLLVFLVFQGVLRVPWTIALPQIEGFREWLKSPNSQWIWIVVLCVSAGIFEETGRWVGCRFFFKPEDRVWKNALMFGAGHGGVEALVVALLQFSGAAFYLLLHVVDPAVLKLPPEKAAEALTQFAGLKGWEPLLGLWERLGTLVVHVGLSVMVLQFFRRSRAWLFWAILAHSLTNLTVFACQLLLKKGGWNVAAMIVPELAVTVFAIVAFLVIVRMRDPSPCLGSEQCE